MVILFLGALTTACDTSGRMATSEKVIQTQSKTIEALEIRINDLENRLVQLEWLKDPYNKVTLDPSDQGYGRLDTSVGTFVVSMRQVSAHADGVRVRLHIGNLTTARVSGGKFNVRWGTRMPNSGEKDWKKQFAAWQKSILSKEISFMEELRPGTWNNVNLILPGVPPEKFGYLELQMETSRIKLLVP